MFSAFSSPAGSTTRRVYLQGSTGFEDLGGAEVEQRQSGAEGDINEHPACGTWPGKACGLHGRGYTQSSRARGQHWGPRGERVVKLTLITATRKRGHGSAMAMTDWNFLWKSRVPPKVRLFAWRCGHNPLPMLQNLSRRRVATDTTCSCCSLGTEDMHTNSSRAHSLVSCGHCRACQQLLFLRRGMMILHGS
ncbi:hypothetical protein Salat_2693100 [Sesamum alatum]|uniref:Reverse transcriptase zinc-binding domain-containing protein n=1 Tax=Sesamum alatum TaxID=300844 RepID=A0AAE1XQN7_9LAMI|nr:hypothetical protein Salat_2693100 [Sesamum alatum]